MSPYNFSKLIIEARKFFSPKSKDQDFSAFVSDVPLTRKQLLIEECKRQDVSIYIDDTSEQSAGVYANLRAVASEAELERRLNAEKAIMNAEKAVKLSNRANVIAFFAFIVSAITLVKSFL